MAIALSGSSDGNNIAGTSSQVSSEIKKGAGEMVGGCSVCSDDQGTEENPLVYCDGCEVAVHQACYGIIDVPAGNWFCRKCESGDSQNKIKCELCPSKDGALKKTETGLWAHVVCALYIPEVRFGNNNTMEPIEIRHIQADRYNKNCYLCEESNNSSTAAYGAVMDCYKLGCKQSFHVTCAQTAGLLCEEAGQASDNVIYCGYCKHHFRKLKAGNRKSGNSLNNSRSSYLDSASDSSQDNDSQCNITEHDKNSNRANKLLTLPTNLSMSDALTTNTHLSTPVTLNKTTPMPNNTPISLTIPLNSTSSHNKSTTSNSSSTPQKKKRAPRNVQGNSSCSATINSSTLLTTTESLPNSLTAQSSTAPFLASNVTNQLETSSQEDVYKWSNASKEQHEKTTNKSSKKKPTFSTQSSSAKLSNNQSISVNSYNLNKVGSPNLSLSTSPSLASPSNSTKSTSNSSTSSISTTTASSSPSSSTSSNSPSPALLSPNVSNRGSTIRLESPLASNSKTGNNNLLNRLHSESVLSNIALPIGQNSLQTRINLDNQKNDLKKNLMASSSLLSTAVPMPHEPLANPVPGSSSTTCSKLDIVSPIQTGSSTLGCNIMSGPVIDSSTNASSQGKSTTNTQLTVPPLIIPVPQLATNSMTTKPTAKAKAATKGTARKKSTEINENPKSEPKPKASRSKKIAINNSNEANAPKQETKRGKGKAATKSIDTTVIASAPFDRDSSTKTQITTQSSPTKRKSRSASNESSATSNPIKRQRKKKTDTTTQPKDQLSVTSSYPNLSITNPQLLSTTSNAPVGTSPLMVIAPIMNNRLIQGINSVESQDIGNRYFSPMISPYANFDHLNAHSLSRSSLSRLFTASSADNNQTSSSDDPAKAFEELRESTWNHLSKCVLEQAQQFDIPSLIGTLYTLRSENEKLVNKVRDLTMKRDQLIAMNARLDLPGPMLTQHLNNTSPSFSSIVSGLTNSPKGLPTPSPGSAISKQPLLSVGSYNHVLSGSLGPPGFIDRSSPMVTQTHSGTNNIKSSSISTPSPPIGALMAHSTSNRAGLITVNSPYMSNVFPAMNTLSQLGTNPQGSSYYPRQ